MKISDHIKASTILGIFKRSNILGTVSQVSGVPTGAIIESGSNANGKFIKYADGTMICTNLVVNNTQGITTAYGVLFSGATTWTFPVAFSVTPTVSAGCGRASGSSSWCAVGIAYPGVCDINFYDVLSRSIGPSFTWSAIAIGRWF